MSPAITNVVAVSLNLLLLEYRKYKTRFEIIKANIVSSISVQGNRNPKK